jgi:uncharacterized protein (DUF2225 family)
MHLAQIAVKCPRCGSKFNSRQLPVLVDCGIRNSELRQDFAGRAPQPEQYTICTCPACGKADWMGQFPAAKEEAVLNQSSLTPHLQFRNAATQAEQLAKDFYNAGTLYLYAAWCADDNNAHMQANEYRQEAIRAFAKSLQDVSCPINERATVEYLIGELYRRIGNFTAAKAHLQEALPRLPGKLAYMARKIIKLAAEENSTLDSFESPIF